MVKTKKVVVIGLDGATWDVIHPLIQKGKLPTWDYLVKNGSYGNLNSTIPPSQRTSLDISLHRCKSWQT